MKPSVIICSYGAAGKLSASLGQFAFEGLIAHGGEIILVRRRDDFDTAKVMDEFSQTAPVPVVVQLVDRPGLSVARNAGIARASGDLLLFTDDDCRMGPGYIDIIIAEMQAGTYDYGGGGVRDPILFGDATHISAKSVIRPRTLLHAGVVNGNAMFFRREVFVRLGGFREDMGAGSGMPFVGAEDMEMVSRASLAGMTGILLPDAFIVHEHGRAISSPELRSTLDSYDISRGSHYAHLMERGIHESWRLWAGTARPDENRQMNRYQIERLRREFYGAAAYLEHILKNNSDVSSLPTQDVPAGTASAR
jgi:GT2 family glycosyltransferase